VDQVGDDDDEVFPPLAFQSRPRALVFSPSSPSSSFWRVGPSFAAHNRTPGKETTALVGDDVQEIPLWPKILFEIASLSVRPSPSSAEEER